MSKDAEVASIKMLHSASSRNNTITLAFTGKVAIPYDHLNPVALRKAKIVYNFGLSECNRVNNAKKSESLFKQKSIHVCLEVSTIVHLETNKKVFNELLQNDSLSKLAFKPENKQF